MLRMVALGLLIPLGVGVLSAMELRTPPRNTVAVAPPAAETNAGAFDSPGALAKADRLQVAAVSSEPPAQSAPVGAPVAPPDEASIAASEPPKPVSHHRHDPKPNKAATAAHPKSKPRTAHIKAAHIKAAHSKAVRIKTAGIKRIAVSQRSKAADEAGPCRLRAFGGLLKALNSSDCEI